MSLIDLFLPPIAARRNADDMGMPPSIRDPDAPECEQCGKQVQANDTLRYAPFCSARCRWIASDVEPAEDPSGAVDAASDWARDERMLGGER